MDTAGVVWSAVDIPMATKDQRKACYRLGLAKSFVKKLNTIQADAAIKSQLALHAVSVDHPHPFTKLAAHEVT